MLRPYTFSLLSRLRPTRHFFLELLRPLRQINRRNRRILLHHLDTLQVRHSLAIGPFDRQRRAILLDGLLEAAGQLERHAEVVVERRNLVLDFVGTSQRTDRILVPLEPDVERAQVVHRPAVAVVLHDGETWARNNIGALYIRSEEHTPEL